MRVRPSGGKLKQRAAERYRSGTGAGRPGEESGVKRLLTDLMQFSFSSPAFSQLKAICLNPTANFSQRSHLLHESAMIRCSDRTFPWTVEEKRRFRCENWRKIKVEAVAPSWRPCLGATEAPPVSDSRRSRAQKTLTPVPEQTRSPGRAGSLRPIRGDVHRERQCEPCRCVCVRVRLRSFVCVV